MERKKKNIYEILPLLLLEYKQWIIERERLTKPKNLNIILSLKLCYKN